MDSVQFENIPSDSEIYARGYRRVAALVPEVKTGDPEANAAAILKMALEARGKGATYMLTPELSLTGYTCADLFHQQLLLDSAEKTLFRLAESTSRLSGCTLIVGVPLLIGTSLYNCAAVLSEGQVAGIVPKTHIPNYGEFYEKRWFRSADEMPEHYRQCGWKGLPIGNDLIFKDPGGVRFGIEICEDLWVAEPCSSRLAKGGAEIIFNLSASPESIGKHRYLTNLVKMQSGACRCAYVYAGAGAGESSTDLSFSGNALIAENGKILAESERFLRKEQIVTADIDIDRIRHDRALYNTFSYADRRVDLRQINLYDVLYCHEVPAGPTITKLLEKPDSRPFVPQDQEHLDENCAEVIAIQSWGLEQRLSATGCRRLVVGISGGLDSTLALLVACHAYDRLGLDRKDIIGVTMPGEATSDRTHDNAWGLMVNLGVTALEIPIGKAVAQHFSDIGQDPQKHDAAYENSQARERTQILMDLANKEGGMVLGTGDLSELALGWCTYNGDHMSMYAVNASVPKTLVSHLVDWYARFRTDEKTAAILRDIIDTPISPELIPADDRSIVQKTEDLIGPYELHDFYLYHTLRFGAEPAKIYWLAKQAFSGRYDAEVIRKWLVNFYRRFFSQQFKRSCMPDAPKTGSVCLSPRGDWRMPSDACSALWRRQAENLPEEEDATERDLDNAVETMRRGGVILYPTDTIWGIGCDATDEDAVEQIFRIKNRPDSKSMLVLVADTDQLRQYLNFLPEKALEIIAESDRPTTVIYDSPRWIAPMLKAADGSLGIRIAGKDFPAELCRRLGHPIVSTSANLSGQPSAAGYPEISEEIKALADYICETERDSAGDAAPSRIVKVSDSGEVSLIR